MDSGPAGPGKEGRRGHVYLTWEEYSERGGTLDAAAFPPAELRARGRIDRLTAGRVQGMAEVPEAVKVCMMSIIQADGAVGAAAQAESPLPSAFSTDGYSERYDSAGSRTDVIERQLDREIGNMLYGITDDEGVPLLYRGLRP